MTPLDIALYFFIVLAIVAVTEPLYGWYVRDKMNRSLVALQKDVPTMTPDQLDEVTEILNDAEKAGANEETLATTRQMIKDRHEP